MGSASGSLARPALRARPVPSFVTLLLLVASACGGSSSVDPRQVDELARRVVAELALSVPAGKRHAVAIVESPGPVTTAGSSLAEMAQERVTLEVSRSGRLQPAAMDPRELARLVEAVVTKDERLYDQAKLPAVGHFASAEYLMFVRLSVDRGAVELTARLVTVETALTLRGASARASLPLAAGTRLAVALLALLAPITVYGYWRDSTQRGQLAKTAPAAFGAVQCGACGRRIEHRQQVGGRCVSPLCAATICALCWNAERRRTCASCDVQPASRV